MIHGHWRRAFNSNTRGAEFFLLNPDYLIPMHCTGFRTTIAVQREMPKKFIMPSTAPGTAITRVSTSACIVPGHGLRKRAFRTLTSFSADYRRLSGLCPSHGPLRSDPRGRNTGFTERNFRLSHTLTTDLFTLGHSLRDIREYTVPRGRMGHPPVEMEVLMSTSIIQTKVEILPDFRSNCAISPFTP